MAENDVKWTNEQQEAIYQKGENILVAAGAGSGKTAVLVERIIQKILNDNLSIDRLLVVTFTNAAASEMRERILEGLYKKLDECPEDENLQKQIILLGKANISTIHSFCLDVIRNFFFEIDIPSNFKIASSEENTLYQQEIIEDLFDELYETENKSFSTLIDNYATYRGDDKLKEIILEIYEFIQSMPFPLKWLDEKIEIFNIENVDINETPWGKILLPYVKENILYSISNLKVLEEKILLIPEMNKFLLTIQADINLLKSFYDATNLGWDKTIEAYSSLFQNFQRWPVDKSCTLQLKEEIKDKRSKIKDNLKKILSKVLLMDSEQAILDIRQMYEVLKSIGYIIKLFDERFKELKREKNLLYFNDIEHYALEILTRVDENGNIVPTDVAKFYKEKFAEIAIDEYQDSNQVQESILTTISNGNNIFMVGDVKQSIYKFRQACPELFLEKYNSYSKSKEGKGLKIQLFKNFRSRENVIDFTNTVFQSIMSEDLGKLNYTKEEFLNVGATYPEDDNSYSNENKSKTEMLILDLFDGTEQIEESEDSEDEKKDIKQIIVNKELEARIVALKIKEIISSGVKVFDKKLKQLRPVQYRDIVILLRSTKENAIFYEKELINQNIPVYSDSNSEYMETYEIQTILNVLKIIDNPKDDIALVSVLRSEIGNFSDNELTEIRLFDRETSFYQSLILASQNLENELKNKVNLFLDMLKNWKQKSLFMNISELIWDIYTQTGFLTYVSLMPNGDIRKANLKKFFESARSFENSTFKGLFNFIRFFEKIRVSTGDLSAAKIIGENEDVVRIMSIHKSKGLEFPVVILANAGKKSNLMDASKNILLHSELGFGPEYIDYRRRIKYTTLPKLAINSLIKNETLSEEMRILYVALTRAREKLIIVATSNNYEKEIMEKKELVSTFIGKSTVNNVLLKKYNSYKDWLEFVILSNNNDDFINISIIKKQELAEIEKQKPDLIEFPFNRNVDLDSISHELEFDYPNRIGTIIPLKTSVSEIKMIDESNTFINSNLDFKNNRPEFMIESKEFSASQKGTLTHLILQKLDFQNPEFINNVDNIQILTQLINKFIDSLVGKKFITQDEANVINRNYLINFLQSTIGRQLQYAQIIEKEKPFCAKISLKEVNPVEYGKDEENYILVQGIIDLFFKTKDGDWALLDYKTDYVPDNNENYLIEKYKKQLEIYKRALEIYIGVKVSKVVIYSLYMGKDIYIEE